MVRNGSLPEVETGILVVIYDSVNWLYAKSRKTIQNRLSIHALCDPICRICNAAATTF